LIDVVFICSHFDAADKTLICRVIVFEPHIKAGLMRIKVADTGCGTGLEDRPAAVNIL
jgi:hypothetical protein